MSDTRTAKEIFLAKPYQEQADELNAAGMWTTGEDGQPRPMTAEDAKNRPEFAPEAYEDYGDIDPEVIRECQAKINAEYGIDQGGWEPVGDTITRAPKISIRHKISDGFVVFDCERIGVIELEQRLRRQKTGVLDNLCEGPDEILWTAIQNGNADMAVYAFRVMDGVSTEFGDYAFNDVINALREGFDNDVFGFQITRNAESIFKTTETIRKMGPAFALGELAIFKDYDQIFVCRITDANVISDTPRTCTDEESRLLDECNANAVERVKFAKYVIQNGSLAGALFAALGDY